MEDKELEARKVAELMGEGWRATFTKNNGAWDIAVVSPCGNVKVFMPLHRGGPWCAHISAKPDSDNAKWLGYGFSPMQAVRNALDKPKELVKNLTELLETIGDI